MPYPRTLHQYCLPEFFREPPPDWNRRLREISPITENLSHLRFRCFEPHESWLHNTRDVWAVYACTPAKMIHPERAEQFRLHWSELHESQQPGRKAAVSDYQHFMWHTVGVEAKPFWILQGEWGGTPAQYTRREARYLDACDAISEPFPLGFFEPCPFDERAVEQILKRDRLLQACNRYDELEKMDRPLEQRLEDEAAEYVFREQYLKTWSEIMRPSVEFMQSFLNKKASDGVFPDAPEGTANAVSQWKDHFLEHGNVIGTRTAKMRKLQVAVA